MDDEATEWEYLLRVRLTPAEPVLRHDVLARVDGSDRPKLREGEELVLHLAMVLHQSLFRASAALAQNITSSSFVMARLFSRPSGKRLLRWIARPRQARRAELCARTFSSFGAWWKSNLLSMSG
jgi:hypothetical protein